MEQSTERQHPLPVVLDANIFVAAQWNPGSAGARLLRLCEEGRLNLCHSQAIRREVTQTLRNTHAPVEFMERVHALFAGGTAVLIKKRIRAVKDDPDDDKYLECAVAAAATVITNDRHLLSLDRYEDVEILRPTQMVERLRSTGEQRATLRRRRRER